MIKKTPLFGLISLGLLAFIPLGFAEGFSDVSEDNPFFKAIEYVKSEGIVAGYADGTYQAEREINRAEFTKIIVEATVLESEIESCQSSNFPDVSTGDWFAKYVCIANQKGIINGYPDGTYKPANNINFVEAAKIIALTYGQEESSGDVWFEDYVRYLGHEGAIPTSISALDQFINRGQMAEMIYRLQNSILDKPSFIYESFVGSSLSGETFCHDGHCHNESTTCIVEGCNEISVSVDGSYRYIEGNGLPNHETGSFPNSGNPNSISEQSGSYKMTLNPAYTSNSTGNAMTPGVALNGVFFEPGTAERNGDLNIEGLQDEYNLGMDENNAHVQPTGAYHYHGIPTELVAILEGNADLVHVGWAADGHQMYVSRSEAYAPSWQLRDGTRSDIGGTYDGTYTQDFEFIEGSGNLDECNGIEIEGEYIYLLTEDFPYISRCLRGAADSSFAKGPGSAGLSTSGSSGQPGPPNGQSGPPQAAIDACNSKTSGSSCSFTDGERNLSGTCGSSPDGMVCKP